VLSPPSWKSPLGLDDTRSVTVENIVGPFFPNEFSSFPILSMYFSEAHELQEFIDNKAHSMLSTNRKKYLTGRQTVLARIAFTVC
jgi:hypothetical protein